MVANGNGLLSAAASTLSFTIVVDVSLSVDHSIAVLADIRAGAIMVVHSVLIHMVANGNGLLSTTSALAILIVAVLGFVQNFAAGGANYIVSAVAIINNLLYANMVASVAADAGAGLKNAGCDLVIGDLAVLIDSVNTVMGCIDRNISGAGFLGLNSTTSALAILVVAVLGSAQNFFAGGANYIVSAVAIINNLLYANMLASVAAGAGAGLKNAGCDLVIGDLAVLIDSVNTVMGCIDRNISGAGFFNRLCSFLVSTDTESTGFGANVSTLSIILKSARHIVIPDYRSAVSLVMDNFMMSRINGLILGMCSIGCSSESSRSHGQNHCACQHGGQKTAELFQFHKTDLLYTTKFLILPRAASQFIHAWTAGASHFRNILRVVQWFTLGLPPIIMVQ